MDESTYKLQPGQKHMFSYRKKTTFFLPAPYTSCSDEIAPWMKAIFYNYPQADYGYSQSLCFGQLLQIYT